MKISYPNTGRYIVVWGDGKAPLPAAECVTIRGAVSIIRPATRHSLNCQSQLLALYTLIHQAGMKFYLSPTRTHTHTSFSIFPTVARMERKYIFYIMYIFIHIVYICIYICMYM